MRSATVHMLHRLFNLLVLSTLIGACIGLVLVADQPIEPGRFAGYLRIDAPGMLVALLSSATILAAPGRGLLRLAALAALLAACCLTHPYALAGAMLIVTLALERGRAPLLAGVSACALLAGGLGLIAVTAGAWRYNLPTAGAGLNSASFAMLLAATLLGNGSWRIALRPAPAAPHPLLVLAWGYPLLRLIGSAPWNLGWSLAAILFGAATALWAAWRAVRQTDDRAWLLQSYAGLALVGVGLASGAGLALACFALGCLPLLVPLLAHNSAAEHGPPAWLRALLPWTLSAATPLSLPFVTIWMGIGAAFTGGATLLAALIWAVGLLNVVPLARLARTGGCPGWAATWAAGLSFGLGACSPLLARWLVQPVIEQQQGGLSPYGDLGFWPWAGLFALDAAKQPVATLPSLALALLMLVLCALAWLAVRLRAVLRHGESAQDRGA